jgi:RHS repeat-associated protein
MANRLQTFGKPISPAATERLFAGLLYDSQAELYYVRNRFYDPNTGRFLQRDRVPARWAIEPYVYAGNNPVNNRDPFGLSPEGGESWRTDEMVWDNVTKPSLFAAGSEALGRLPEVGESLALESAKRIEGYRGAGRVAAGAVLMAGEKGAAAVDFVAQTHEVLWILFSKCTTKAAVDWYKEQWWNPASKYVDQFMSVGGFGSRR